MQAISYEVPKHWQSSPFWEGQSKSTVARSFCGPLEVWILWPCTKKTCGPSPSQLLGFFFFFWMASWSCRVSSFFAARRQVCLATDPKSPKFVNQDLFGHLLDEMSLAASLGDAQEACLRQFGSVFFNLNRWVDESLNYGSHCPTVLILHGDGMAVVSLLVRTHRDHW